MPKALCPSGMKTQTRWFTSLPIRGPDELNRELKKATYSSYSWAIRDMASNDGHSNVGRTATRGAVTGGVGLLFGASRTKGAITVNWEDLPPNQME